MWRVVRVWRSFVAEEAEEAEGAEEAEEAASDNDLFEMLTVVRSRFGAGC